MLASQQSRLAQSFSYFNKFSPIFGILIDIEKMFSCFLKISQNYISIARKAIFLVIEILVILINLIWPFIFNNNEILTHLDIHSLSTRKAGSSIIKIIIRIVYCV